MNHQRTVIWQIIPHLALGGATRVALWLCQHLDPDRYEVRLLSGREEGSEGQLREEAEAAGVAVSELPGLQRNISPAADLHSIRHLRRLLRAEQPALLHAHGSKALVIAGFAARGTRTRTVHTAHGWPFHQYMNPPARSLQIHLLRTSLRQADAIVAVSAATREKGLQARVGKPSQYHVIYPGAELERFLTTPELREHVRSELGLPLEAPVVGSVMRLSPQKAPLNFVRAAALVCQQRPEVHFVVIGDGSLRPAVEDAIAQFDLGGRFHLAGSRTDVERLLGAFDVFALCSRWEGLPIVYAEAAAAALPVVGTAVDGAAELVEHGVTGYLTQPEQPAELAQRILQVLQNPAAAQAMGQAGRAKVLGMGFAIKEVVGHYERLYQQLLSG